MQKRKAELRESAVQKKPDYKWVKDRVTMFFLMVTLYPPSFVKSHKNTIMTLFSHLKPEQLSQ
jgi:hypothetical protein